MNELKQLLAKCKASVTITANNHRDYYQSVEEYLKKRAMLEGIEGDFIEEIGVEVFEEMKASDTVIEVRAYPDSPISFFEVFHHDIEEALRIALNSIEGQAD